MSQTDQPNPRHRRGGRKQGRPNRHQGSRSQSNQKERGDRTPREDHRDWEPVDRGRDIRRRAAEKPSFFQKMLSTLSFGLLGGKSKAAKPKTKPASSAAAKSEKPAGRPASYGDREARPAKTPREPRQATPPDPGAVTTPRLHVGNLSYDAAESDLTSLFNGVGKVQNVEVVYHRDTQRSKGFAFIQMLTVDEAKRAVTELHGKDYMGRTLEIGPARAPGQTRERDRRREDS
jgi:RNA recognition motif-containing protein